MVSLKWVWPKFFMLASLVIIYFQHTPQLRSWIRLCTYYFIVPIVPACQHTLKLVVPAIKIPGNTILYTEHYHRVCSTLSCLGSCKYNEHIIIGEKLVSVWLVDLHCLQLSQTMYRSHPINCTGYHNMHIQQASTGQPADIVRILSLNTVQSQISADAACGVCAL